MDYLKRRDVAVSDKAAIHGADNRPTRRISIESE